MSPLTPSLLAYWGLTSTAWIVLWSVLATLTVLLVVLLRTRWSSARPWRKCAVLSLWVHVLLACVATTVRIVTGAPELGSGEPIRVAVIPIIEVAEEKVDEQPEEITPEQEAPAEMPPEIPDAPPLEAPALESLPENPAPNADEKLTESTEPREPDPPLDAPPLVDRPAPQELTGTEAIAEPPAPAAPEDSTAKPQAELPTAPGTTPHVVAPPPTPVEQTPLPETYADRFAKDREQLVAESGGSAQTEQAVRAALGWLADAQSSDGGWDASRFGAGEERVVLGHNRNRAGADADTGVSGLALLAFLGAGHTHRGSPYADEVADGLEYLRQRQRADGALFGDAQLFARMYCHSMATFAVCEAYALTRDERLEPMARAAVRFTLAMQHPTDGGWRYRRGDTGDTSQLGWQLMTLKSAEFAGIAIPSVTWTRVDRFLRRVRRGDMGGLAAYRPDGPPSRTMTAEAMYCRLLQRSQGLGDLHSAAALEATRSITAELPSAARRNLYFWYYASLALHQNRAQSPAAAAAWDDWNHALTTTLVTTQQDDGSWSAATVWGGYGGRVYTTALSAMCLEVYYRYSGDSQPSELAGRRRPAGAPR